MNTANSNYVKNTFHQFLFTHFPSPVTAVCPDFRRYRYLLS